MNWSASERTARILRLVEQHEAYRGRECLNLRADENLALAEAKTVLSSDMGNRNTSPDPRFKYRGTDYMVELGELVEQMGKELFRAEYLNYWCPTGHTANILLYLAFCQPGDRVMSLGPPSGGYGGMAFGNLPTLMGLDVLSFPFDLDRMNIDEDASIELILREKPSLVVFGATYFLFPQPIKKIADAVHSYGGVVAYDGAHVLGLVACGQFQDPLREGADILFGSTMKSFAGPAGGLIATNDPKIAEKIDRACFYGAVTAVQWNRIPALGITFDYLLTEGEAYAKRIVDNAQTLGEALEGHGVPIMFRDLGYTRSHVLLLDLGGMDKNVAGGASAFSTKLESCNIIIDDRGRIGLSEVSRIGMGRDEMLKIAALMGRAVAGDDPETVKAEVKALRERYL